MTRDELIKILKSYNSLHRECIRLRKRVNDKKTDIYYIQGLVTDRVSVRSGEIFDRVERVVEKINSMIHYYIQKADEAESAEQHVIHLIDRISDSDNRSILFLHYVEGKTIDEISEILPLSPRCIWYRHNAALDEILEKCEM